MKKYGKLLIPLSGILAFVIGIIVLACILLKKPGVEERDILEVTPTLGDPVFSVPGGFYDEAFQLEISAPEGCLVYYTTDGTIPNPTSLLSTTQSTATGQEKSGSNGETLEAVAGPYIYDKPILISCDTSLSDSIAKWLYDGERSAVEDAITIRAICVNSAGQRSNVLTNTYFVGAGEYADKTVVSIVMEPDDLFGENGIYTNYEGRGADWEKEINLEIFDPVMSPEHLNQPAGIRIQGSSSREQYAKRFSVYSRKEYSGHKTFDQIFLGEVPIHAFVLREGFMNAFIQHLIQDRDIASAQTKETLVFVNGHFWYATMMQEKYNSTFFEKHYGFKKDNVILIKGNEADSDDPGDLVQFQELYEYIRNHDLSDDQSYEGFGKLADVQSYIDFCCVNLYFGNLDFNEEKNVYYWRSRKNGKSPYEDCRWRWGLYDLDLENLDYGFYEQDINTFNLDTHYAGSAFNTRETYVALKKNPSFCRDFVNTFMDLINTEFTLENAENVFQSWNCTPSYWRKDEDWCASYFPARNEKMPVFIREEFGLSADPVTLHLSLNDIVGGSVRLNTIQPSFTSEDPSAQTNRGGWSGRYFQDYPVTLEPIPSEGYQFSHWLVNGEIHHEETLELTLSPTGDHVEAIFIKSTEK